MQCSGVNLTQYIVPIIDTFARDATIAHIFVKHPDPHIENHRAQEAVCEQKHSQALNLTQYILPINNSFARDPALHIGSHPKIIVLRKLCVSRNTARLSSFPSHPSLACPSCTKKMRLWPEQVVESTALFGSYFG